MAASNTLMKVKKADTAPALDRVLKVRGSEQTNETTAPIAAKPMVQTVCATRVQLLVTEAVGKSDGLPDIVFK
jgi:hypothetical protein